MASRRRITSQKGRLKKAKRSSPARPPKRATKPGATPNRAARSRCLIVGVGASAGGLEAFTELLRHLPTDTGMAFVLVQHLDPARESALTSLLSKATSLSVREAVNDLPVEPDHIYVIPPNSNLSIVNAVLKIEPRRLTDGAHRSIDFFFESLAQDQHHRAIGVILSGTATDGTLGLEAIKAESGITFAQDGSAKYDSMPRSAIAAGCVDFICKPEDIAKELGHIAKHPVIAGRREPVVSPEDDRAAATAHENDDTPLPSRGHGAPHTGARQARAEGEARGKPGDDGFKRILRLLRDHSGVDFSLYKSNTIQRRIARRLVLTKHETLEAYARFLRGNAKELDTLYSDVLISVTSFFRNPGAFGILQHKVFPKLLQQRGDDPLRVWVLGCSTGQEAYSIAMAFSESAAKAPRMRKLQVFATDLNDALLDKARHGLYAKSIVQDVSPERLRRFFVEEEGGYRVSKALREMVAFARQNLINDPPFSRMDFVSCRNLLIYLEPSLQKKAIPTFHYSLKPEGFLFLGASESVAGFTDLFETVDRKHKIYSKKAGWLRPTICRLENSQAKSPSPRGTQPAGLLLRQRKLPEAPQGLRAELNSEREADRITANQYAPPGVLVNDQLQVLQFRGPTGAYLEPPAGKASFDVLKMAREGLMLPLRAAINQARKQNTATRREQVQVRRNGETRTVNVEVVPLKNLRERCFLILFEDAQKGEQAVRGTSRSKAPGGAARTRRRAGRESESRRIAGLERELSETRDYLQSVQEQHEAANEELQASSEEVQSANEELQSINEELETSKEELESANEELITVNEEMTSRNSELNRLNADLVNFQTSTPLAVLLLGRDLTIRRFNPRAEQPFNLSAADVGRPIGYVRHNLDLADLDALVGRVIDTVREEEREVRDKEGRWYSLRARPYLTLDNKVDGAVLMLVDIDALKRAELAIIDAQQYAEAIVRTVPDPLIVLDGDMRVQSANDSFYRTFQISPAEAEGRSLFEIGAGAWRIPELRRLLEDILPRNSFFGDFEVTHEFEHLGRRTMQLNARTLLQSEGKVKLVLLGIQDVTIRNRAEDARGRLAAIVEWSDDAIIGKNLDSIITSWNHGAERLFGYKAQEAIGQSITILIPPDRIDEEAFIIARIRSGESVEHYDTVRRRKDGTLVDISLTASPVKNAEGRVVGVSKVARDITTRRQMEQELQQSEERLRLSQAVARVGTFDWNIETGANYWTPELEAMHGLRPGEFAQTQPAWASLVHPDDRAAALSKVEKALQTGEAMEGEWRVLWPDGSVRWLSASFQAFKGQTGKPTRLTGVNIDITERKQAEQRIQFLMGELAHRGQNQLAVIQSIASRSLAGARPLAEARDVLMRRLHALGRSQSALMVAGFEGVALAKIVRLEFEGFSERVDVAGPDVTLNPKAAQTFALMLHELATNASKYGALSQAGGRVDIHWSVEGAGTQARFKFAWREHGGPPVVAPKRQGFGRTVLEKAVAQDFGTQPKNTFAPEGLRYEIDAPLAAVAASAVP